MKKLAIIGAILAGLFLIGTVGSSYSEQSVEGSSTVQTNIPKIVPTCDGTTVTSNCTLDGINYKTYIYHPDVAEKTHIEEVVTYKEEVTGYCTLCNDGTYSPSCSTGRGTCSHHGGVDQWNAPRISRVPIYSTKMVIDEPAKKAFYEKILE